MIDALSQLEEFDKDEQPWCDLVFEIDSVRRERNGWFRPAKAIAFQAAGLANGKEVGFGVRVHLTDWKGQPHDNVRLSWNTVELTSRGRPTDDLVALYEEWFGLDRSGACAVNCRCQAVLLNDDPLEIERQPAHMKLFFEPVPRNENGDDYAELYLNFDLPNRRAWLREKDPGYRNALVAWLSGRYRPAHESVH